MKELRIFWAAEALRLTALAFNQQATVRIAPVPYWETRFLSNLPELKAGLGGGCNDSE